MYIYAIVMLKREKNALIDSSSPNLCGKIPFSSWQVRNVCKPCKAGSSKMGPTKIGGFVKVEVEPPEVWTPIKSATATVFLVGKKKNHDRPPGIST